MLYEHWSIVPWDAGRWPNFKPDEPRLACPMTGEFWFDPIVLDALQSARVKVGRPFRINSGHRCPIYNATVGGRPLSMHKKIAIDISYGTHDRDGLFMALKEAGFSGFGFYNSFIHVDFGRRRQWGITRKDITCGVS